ncbi:MAG: type II/IV secretion system protein, partial [Gammaproteobacteria bacterium]
MTSNNLFMQYLVENEIINEADSKRLSQKYAGNAQDVLYHLLKGGAKDKNILGKLWGDSYNFSYVNLENTIFQQEAVKKIPYEYAKENGVIPVYYLNNVLTVAMAEPYDEEVVKVLKQTFGVNISQVFSFREEIEDAIEIQYQSHDAINGFIESLANNSKIKGTSKVTGEQLKKLAGDKAVIELTRSLMLLAIKEKASDIHVDPQEEMVYVRFRIDGVLQDRLKLDSMMLSPLVSRLKVMASLDITEKRRPQDGRVKLKLSNKSIDFRMSSMPTVYGEKVVLRSLGQIVAHSVPDIEALDLSVANYKIMKNIIDTPNGIFFVTGPTGSGKTTTLFSVLKYLNKPGVNIMTVEDPVEYRLPRVNQVQVNNAIGFDFTKALRSFLRQDPDVILIGEIRDVETAKIASQAALTGHLVLATIHTNNSLQAVTRLVEMGVEPFLVAPSIIGVMAQRLVRRICPHCKESYVPEKDLVDKYFDWDGVS